ncbi:hypothetical protein SRS16CHR_02587 [Variovorax sp. SRS16]|uniref:hypothetical protein n=1 Tax=Variovorax sp. SRS16 TaxID=282217 RepID=UPI001318D3AA|nr:hypothetical protein [Variovorax sp. SRS16]VTU20162.1 hypothetical protein SRS16CHR_02587 [Variovorax sp. SRS16]
MAKPAVAKDIAPSNVLSFPRVALTTGRRRGRTRVSGNVLKFTGTKRYNYDRGEALRKWQNSMAKAVMDLWQQIQEGEITGMVLVTTPTDGKKYRWRAGGVFIEDKDTGRAVLVEVAKELGEWRE